MAHFTTDWHVLGPFAIGTREDSWTDSVDIYNTEISDQVYRSALCRGATWKAVEMNLLDLDRTSTKINLDVSYPEVDWTDLIKTYGWVATQFDAWIRGTLILEEAGTVSLSVQKSPEFLLNGVRYLGDIYELGHPITLYLQAGEHRIDIRIVNEIRIFGFHQDPTASINITVHCLGAETEFGTRLKIEERFLPDCLLLAGRIPFCASKYGSLRVTNITRDDLYIWIESLADHKIHLASLQSRDINIDLDSVDGLISIVSATSTCGKEGTRIYQHKLSVSKALPIDRPHVVTYQHPNGTLGRAILRTPQQSTCDRPKVLPILLALHGAGVDITNSAWKDAFAEEYGNAWILQPDCGKWGDDWHALSAISIDCAIASVSDWITRHDWNGAAVDDQKILVMGHSVSIISLHKAMLMEQNGSQGAMQYAVRNSDRVIGAVFAAGYTSIDRYVPYSLWTSNAASHVLQPEYDILQNLDLLQGVACYIKHGVLDDNVSIYHSRLLAASLGPEVELEEVEDKGHYWDGILTEGRCKRFVEERLTKACVPILESFSVPRWDRPVIKGGICVSRIDAKARLPAHVAVKVVSVGKGKTLHITTNAAVRAIRISPKLYAPDTAVVLDGVPSGRVRDYDGPVDATKGLWDILDSSLRIVDGTGDGWAHRVAHAMLALGVDCSISSRLQAGGEEMEEEEKEISLTYGGETSFQRRGRTLTITAEDGAGMSRVLRLLPTRPGMSPSSDTSFKLEPLSLEIV